MGKSRRAEALALLGLARRAGAVVKGTDATRRGLRSGEVRLVIVARDGSSVQQEKVLRLARHREVPWRSLANQVELGAALGDGPLTVVGVTGADFATSLSERLSRT